MECTFQVGDKVVCTALFNDGRAPNYPKMGGVYTVREVYANGNLVGLLLVEIQNKPATFFDGFREISFWHRAFKPLIQTDISDLQRIVREVFDKRKVDA